jgi:assimilatory nitrate reductase catalytic subunit
VLNTGRVRDHWHTMTRTGKSARLSAHIAEPYAEINTVDALRFNVRAGELATLRSAYGSMVVRVRTGTEIPAGMVFAPIHWNRAFASDARVGALTNPVVDPISGEPELKHTPVSLEHFEAKWHAVMLTRSVRPPPVTQWWTKVQGEKFVRCELAGNHSRDWAIEARRLLGVPAGDVLSDVDWIEYRDPARRVYRAAWFVQDRLEGCIYFDRLPELPERAWLGAMFTHASLDAAARTSLLAGRALEGCDQGAPVCSCFGVGANPIAACARELGAAATPAEIGKRLKCGTNCGSCVPEIQAIIREVAKKTA